MKSILTKTFVIVLLIIGIVVNAQQRGFKPVKVNINGNLTQLYSQSHALVIGISEYNNGWAPLPGVKEDVQAVKSALERVGFNVEMLQDANKEQIDKKVSTFINNYGQEVNNRLLVYFAGHGHTVKTSYGDELGYIVPVDAVNPTKDLGLFQSKSLEMAQIEIYAKRIQSKHALFVFDACFAGSLFDMRSAGSEIITYKTTKPVRQFITSGGADEQVPDKSIFRRQFVEALTTNSADMDKDGYLTGSELGQFLQSKVVNYSYNTQHPQYGKIRNPNLDKGDFVFEIANSSNTTVSASEKVETPTFQPGKVEPQYGSITINSEIGGMLYLDGKAMGQISQNSKGSKVDKITVGNHTVKIGDIEKTVDVTADKTSVLDFQKPSELKTVDNTFVNYDTEKHPKPSNSKYGVDSVSCIRNMSLYREYFKQKNYKDALSLWNHVYDECPGAQGNRI